MFALPRIPERCSVLSLRYPDFDALNEPLLTQNNAILVSTTFAKTSHEIFERPETWVTDRTGHIGYAFSPFGEEAMPWKGVR